MEERLYFPLFFDLSEKTVLVAGGGKIAARRVRTLLPFAGRVVVVAPEPSSELTALAAAGEVELRRRGFDPCDLDGADLALCATGDETVDARVVELCRTRGIWVNAASDRGKCDFYFPGVARRDNIVVGVTASGADHAAARVTTEAIRKLLEDE